MLQQRHEPAASKPDKRDEVIRARVNSMMIKLIKWSALTALIAIAFTRTFPDLELLLSFVISAAAIVVLVQATNLRRFIWTGLFLAIACLFNPIIHVPLPEYVGRVVIAFTILLFFFSLALLNPAPKLSIASTTDPLARRQSL
jgi:hypothetical protein